MKDLKVIFMGTPVFCVPILEELINKYNVIMVVSQPDKEKDRKGNIIYSPCKEIGIKNNIEVYQPIKIREEYQYILDKRPDIIITAAYGQIIPSQILDYPKYGCINVHGSLLPKLRGGAPIHHAIINGDKEAGVTIMYMDKKMDSGDIISQRSINIDDNMILDDLYYKLSILGRDLLIDTLPSILNGTNNRIKQNEEEVTYGLNITKEEELINFNDSVSNVHNKIRGLSSIPGAYAMLNNKRMKIYLSEKTNNISKEKPGTITDINKNGITVSTKDYDIILKNIKLEGKNRCDVKDFINGIKKENFIGGYFMNLITEDVEKLFLQNPLYSHENEGFDAQVLVKFFNPCGAGTWLITEARKEDDDWLLFGYMHIFEWEWGYVLLSELQSIRLPYGLTICMEANLHMTVKQLLNGGF